uniref:Uncharacterized protein n=1 Tax=Micrurus corallinus TaxID=54390 RepID=A0A2D4FGY0_MICCO
MTNTHTDLKQPLAANSPAQHLYTTMHSNKFSRANQGVQEAEDQVINQESQKEGKESRKVQTQHFRNSVFVPNKCPSPQSLESQFPGVPSEEGRGAVLPSSLLSLHCSHLLSTPCSDQEGWSLLPIFPIRQLSGLQIIKK